MYGWETTEGTATVCQAPNGILTKPSFGSLGTHDRLPPSLLFVLYLSIFDNFEYIN